MTPQQISSLVEGYKPTGIEGAAEGYARYGAMRQAADQVFADRHQDPMKAAIDSRLGPQPINWQNFDAAGTELRSRFAALPSLRKQIGGDVPPLTKTEAAGFAAAVERMPSKDQLRTLMSVRGQLPKDEDFYSLMRTVLPHAPVVAIVGARGSTVRMSE